MKKFNIRRIAISLGIVLCVAVLLVVRYYYFDVYLMTLNGRVKKIRVDIKQTMHITINKEYDLEHYWPVLQEKVVVGDSLYKKSGQYDITLIKWQKK